MAVGGAKGSVLIVCAEGFCVGNREGCVVGWLEGWEDGWHEEGCNDGFDEGMTVG